MAMDEKNTITNLLKAWQLGDRAAFDQLAPLVHRELRRIARHTLRRERRNHSLQPTALVNEAYLRLVDHDHAQWNDRAHFLSVAATVMRRVLVDHARSRNAEKRGRGVSTVQLDEQVDMTSNELDLVRLDDALAGLGRLDARQARVVELRFFGGLTIDETALVLGVSTATVKREWRTARAWLFHELSGA